MGADLRRTRGSRLLPFADWDVARNRVYRVVLVHDGISQLGLWVLQLAAGWIVFAETGSATLVGLVQTVFLLPIPVAAAVSGSLMDRMGPRVVIRLAYGGLALSSATISLATIAGVPATGPIFAAMAFAGFSVGFYLIGPAVLIGRIVEHQKIGPAIALSVLTIGVARIIAGPVAGAPLAAWPEWVPLGACVLFVCAAAVTFALPAYVDDPGPMVGHQAGPGLALGWIRDVPGAVGILSVAILASALIFPYNAMLPVIVRSALHEEAFGLGLLTTAGGVGVLGAGLFMTSWARRIGRGQLVIVALEVGALSLVALGTTSSLTVAMVMVATVSAAIVTWAATANALLMSLAPPRMRARLLALHSSLFYLVLPASSALFGALADTLGVAIVLVSAGLLGVVGLTVVMARNPSLRRLGE